MYIYIYIYICAHNLSFYIHLSTCIRASPPLSQPDRQTHRSKITNLKIQPNDIYHMSEQSKLVNMNLFGLKLKDDACWKEKEKRSLKNYKNLMTMHTERKRRGKRN